MPIQPNFFEQTLFLTLNVGPGPMLDVWGAVGFRVVVAGARLGVFEALAERPRTAEALAAQLTLDQRGTASLLGALEAFGYVREHAGTYANTAMTAKWMLRGAGNFTAGFEFWGVVLPQLWDRLEDSLRAGRPPVNLYTRIEDQPAASRAFQEYMVALAGFITGEVEAPLLAGTTLVVGAKLAENG